MGALRPSASQKLHEHSSSAMMTLPWTTHDIGQTTNPVQAFGFFHRFPALARRLNHYRPQNPQCRQDFYV
jgi:hypothetical protein